ncbi:nucleoside-diphosphate kinase [Candidatus Kuenenbacteria bacterium]|nr:nucleoside-diphosphate kinase [Candidatus Kuenenbacteria bacterium]
MKNEKTLVMIKPDGIQRSLMGEIIKRFERVGLKMVAAKMIVPTTEQIEKHYTLDPEWRRVTGEKTIKGYKDKGLEPPSEDPLEITAIILKNLKNYMSSGPVLAMIWQGVHSVKIVRKLVGGTEPFTSDVGTIRGDYVIDSYQLSDQDNRSIRNLVHASGSVEEANMEIEHWFKPEEIIDYRVVQEQVLYDPTVSGK